MVTPIAKSPKPLPKAPAAKAAPSGAKKEVLDLTPLELPIPSIRAGTGLELFEALALGPKDGIASSFSLDLVEGRGRHAQGFRLDAGSLQSLWLSARVVDHGGKRATELFFYASPEFTRTIAKRLKTAGGKRTLKGFHFEKAEVKKGALVRGKVRFSPDAKGLWVYKKDGEFQVELAPSGPEALRGAVRIRLFGTAPAQKKTLAALTQKLGLQTALAPASPAALERLRLSLALRHLDHAAWEELATRPFEEVPTEAIRAAVDELEDVESQREAIDGVDLADPKVERRVRRLLALLEADFAGFRALADDSSYSGLLPGEYEYHDQQLDQQLDKALKKAGVTAAAQKKALKAPLDPEAVDRMLRFGLLAAHAGGAATELLRRELSAFDPLELEAALKAAGVGKKAKEAIEFREVYPGYFTVVCPTLAERCHEAGARYLYSTYDDADRVVSALLGGQKSSLTRFQEGILVEGKSSSADFESGGAKAVFTRLVTKSVIQKAKKASAGSWGHTFNNWGGSRPFKLILSPTILGRTDWWGANHDSFGSTKALKAENFGIEIVKSIDKNYSSSNELMFPIGNDPSYVELVVCETAEQKQALVAALEKAGITEWKGRTLDQFVRIADKFFEL